MKRMAPLVLTLLLLLVSGVQAQVEPLPTDDINPEANITWPPPVYTLRGEFEVRGTANLPEMTNFFLEYRPLGADLLPLEAEEGEEEAAWIPATLPNPSAVVDDVLGVWDTTSEADGLYELRLVLNLRGADPFVARVSPLRIENEPPPFAITATPAAPVEQPTIVPLPTLAPTTAQLPTATLQPTPTAFDPTPRVSPGIGISVNVRAGDGTGYDIIGSLAVGESARIIGRSSTGSGWYYVELANGSRGWVAGDVVSTSGNISGLPPIAPPATPTPTASPTPSLPDATLIGIRYDRGEVRQDEEFQVIVRVRNNSGVSLPDTQVLCTVKPQNVERSSSVGVMNAFEERDVFLNPLTLTTGGGSNITVDCAIDVNRLVAEIDDNNNFFSITTPLRAP